jgi:hypothetical protein
MIDAYVLSVPYFLFVQAVGLVAWLFWILKV